MCVLRNMFCCAVGILFKRLCVFIWAAFVGQLYVCFASVCTSIKFIYSLTDVLDEQRVVASSRPTDPDHGRHHKNLSNKLVFVLFNFRTVNCFLSYWLLSRDYIGSLRLATE